MRYALLADIHSNIHALDAVLEDLAQQQPVDEIIANGDSINGGPAPREVIMRLQSINATVIRGNHEQYVLNADAELRETPDIDRPLWSPSYWTLAKCTTDDLIWMDALPMRIVREDIAIMHGSPNDLRGGIRQDTPDENIPEDFLSIEASTIVTAHTHIPFVRNWRGKQLINPGSVGMPLDDNPAAAYIILTVTPVSAAFEFRRVPYDVRPVLQLARDSGLLAEGGLMSRVLLAESLTGRRFIVPFITRVQRLTEQGVSEADALQTAYDEQGLELYLQ